MMKPRVEHLLDFTSATVGTLELLRFQTDPAGTYYAWKVMNGISWDQIIFRGFVAGQATAIGKNSKSVTDFLEKKCLGQQWYWRLVSKEL